MEEINRNNACCSDNKGQAIKPNNNLVGAILTTIFCCLPLGVVSIIYASQVDSQWYAGNTQAACELARKSRKWMWIGVVSSLCIWILYLLFVVVLGIGAALFA